MKYMLHRIKILNYQLDNPEVLDKNRIENKLEAYNECLKSMPDAYMDFFTWFMSCNLDKYNLKTLKEEIVTDYLKSLE